MVELVRETEPGPDARETIGVSLGADSLPAREKEILATDAAPSRWPPRELGSTELPGASPVIPFDSGGSHDSWVELHVPCWTQQIDSAQGAEH